MHRPTTWYNDLMNDEIEISLEAYQLANRPYTIHMAQDGLSHGKVCWVAEHPELDGCMTQGDTKGEAQWSLNDARLVWIQACLDDGLAIPPPRNKTAQTVIVIYSLGVKP